MFGQTVQFKTPPTLAGFFLSRADFLWNTGHGGSVLWISGVAELEEVTPMIELLDLQRINRAKRAFTTRRIPIEKMRSLSLSVDAPKPGDVILARVEEVGRLNRIELTTGRKATLYPGDEIVLVYGNRYAPDAYEAEVPCDLSPCDLAAGGGIASRVINANVLWETKGTPTRIRPIAYIADPEGRTLNVRAFSFSGHPLPTRTTPVIAVCGATMNSGKTTTVAGIIRGLTQKGLRVGAAKVTGTGSGNDLWKFHDAGAAYAFDFTDAGMATTYLAEIDAVAKGAEVLISELVARNCGAIVIEIADGVHQRETRALLSNNRLRYLVDRWVYAADSAASAAIGWHVMTECGLPLSAISGLLTASPLAVREAASLVPASFAGLPELTDGSVPLTWIEDFTKMPALA